MFKYQLVRIFEKSQLKLFAKKVMGRTMKTERVFQN